VPLQKRDSEILTPVGICQDILQCGYIQEQDVSHSFKDRILWIPRQDREPQGRLLTAYPEGDPCRKDLSLTDPFPPEPVEGKLHYEARP
jgi:hypothetical protein